MSTNRPIRRVSAQEDVVELDASSPESWNRGIRRVQAYLRYLQRQSERHAARSHRNATEPRRRPHGRR
jgi:hypothetical protein